MEKLKLTWVIVKYRLRYFWRHTILRKPKPTPEEELKAALAAVAAFAVASALEEIAVELSEEKTSAKE